MTRTFGVFSAAVGAILALSTPAFAQNVDCGSALRTEVDHVKESYVQDATTEQDRWYRFQIVAGRSYCVEAVSVPWDTNTADPELSLFDSDCTTPVSGAAATGATNDDSFLEPILWRGSRVCFNASGSATKVAVVNSCCLPTPGAATDPLYFRLRITETTLFSPYWQVVTAASYDAAPQLRNNTNATVNIYMTVYDQNGLANATCNNMQHSIPANGLFIVGLASHCGIASGFGSMLVSHDGAPGAISGNITTFSAASGLSFDAPFGVREKNVVGAGY